MAPSPVEVNVSIATHPLREHCRYVVTFGGQQVASELAEIIVEL
jgi:hypothetical protein